MFLRDTYNFTSIKFNVNKLSLFFFNSKIYQTFYKTFPGVHLHHGFLTLEKRYVKLGIIYIFNIFFALFFVVKSNILKNMLMTDSNIREIGNLSSKDFF